ncbi:molybdate ABC transporter permease subunit [Hyperthermus butylicus]|uniref:ABC-type molybdate transport system, permease component, ModB n=1 Tax=Hyperthermus butylicus (strain DSM 5456 / JCM 9403 / PLM1-5) TaxID=415426 RepID=A2BJT6_HYPBU|nr:ABC transporter permease subunit [Hyperthermus butylicus]ABM80247.1 ABC-type molybdate transport system, permease component, ModB [Hyperthermus butylicus DSM 5456]
MANQLYLLALLPPIMIACLMIASAIAWSSPQAILEALAKPSTQRAVMLSVASAAVASAIAISSAAPTAYVLARSNIPGKALVAAFLTAPLAAPPVATGFLLLVFFTSNPLGRIVDRIIGVVLDVPGIIIAQTAVVYPIALRLLWEVFDAVNPNYEEVARTLGCRTLCRITNILIPLSFRGIIASYGVCFARAMGEFGATVMLAGATRGKTETLPIAIYLSFAEGEPGVAVALSLISIAVAVLFLTMYWVLGGRAWRR